MTASMSNFKPGASRRRWSTSSSRRTASTRFTEYWFPLDKLGGGVQQGDERRGAARACGQGERGAHHANASAQFDDAELIVAVGDGSNKPIQTLADQPFASDAFAATVKCPRQWWSSCGSERKMGASWSTTYTDSRLTGIPISNRRLARCPNRRCRRAPSRLTLPGRPWTRRAMRLAARAAYNEALKLDPGFAPAHIALGLSFYRTGEYERASEHLGSRR